MQVLKDEVYVSSQIDHSHAGIKDDIYVFSHIVSSHTGIEG